MLEQLNYELLQEVEAGFRKRAFVAMPAGQAQPPVAGAGLMTQAQAAPMGAPPMDPSMMGGAPPMDPAMGGMPPMDPAMGGMPPMDPAMMGGDPMAALGGMPAEGSITMSISELIALINVIKGGGGGEAGAIPGMEGEKKPKSSGKADVSAKLDQILAALSGGGGMPPPPMDPSMMGGAPPPMDPAAMGGGAPMPPMM